MGDARQKPRVQPQGLFVQWLCVWINIYYPEISNCMTYVKFHTLSNFRINYHFSNGYHVSKVVTEHNLLSLSLQCVPLLYILRREQFSEDRLLLAPPSGRALYYPYPQTILFQLHEKQGPE